MGYFPGRRIGFGGNEAKTLMLDWAYNARNGKYRLKNSQFDYERELKNVKQPVLAINFNDDGYAPVKATSYLLSKFSQPNPDKILISAKQLGAKKADHFSWIKQPNAVASNVSNWINSLQN